MKKFEDALDVRFIDGHNWEVVDDFYYDTDVALSGPITHRVVVLKGFTTDFASIPRLLWNILPPAGLYGKAAVIHDCLYRTKGLATRAEADRVLLEAMGVSGVGRLTRWTIYLGVRVGGSMSYKGGF